MAWGQRSAWIGLVIGCVLAAPGLGFGVDQPEVLRAGLGSRRSTLDDMELKPAPANLWAPLSDWTGGSAPTPESTKDKPVLIVTWSWWTPASQQLISRASQMSEKYAPKGLVVVAAHTAQGYEQAGKHVQDKGLKGLLLAKDPQGKFRAAIKSDQDPSVYVLDRAGQMRFACIQTVSLEEAIKKVIDETPEQAAKRPAELAEAIRRAKYEAGKTRVLNGQLEPGQRVEANFDLPEGEAYKAALWPPRNNMENAGDSRLGGDKQGTIDPIKLDGANWINRTPRANKGRVTVYYFWRVGDDANRLAESNLVALQRAYIDDVVVIGIGQSGSGQQGAGGSGNPGTERIAMERHLREHPSELPHVLDLGGKIAKSADVRAGPVVMVLSTDGNVRWQGSPQNDNFRKAAEIMIENDPGVQARRKAEAGLIKPGAK